MSLYEAMPHFEGYVYPERSHATAALGRSDRALSLHHRAGGGRVYYGVAGAGVSTCGPSSRFIGSRLLTAFAFLLLRSAAAAVPPGAPGALLRGDDDAALNLADGDFRVCLRLVPYGRLVAGTLV